jgi:predicted acetyltransferase
VDVELTYAAEEDKPALANLVQLNQYDLAEYYRELHLTAHGVFVYRHLDYYFEEAGHEPYLITADNRLAGFALARVVTEQIRVVTEQDEEWTVSEFFVSRHLRRKGVAGAATRLLLRRHPGTWTVIVDYANTPASIFWTALSEAVAAGKIDREKREPPEFDYEGARLKFEVTPKSLEQPD